MDLKNINSISLSNNTIANVALTVDDLNKYDPNTSVASISLIKDIILKQIYPVGSLYINYDSSKSPDEILGFGEWTRITNKYIYAAESSGQGGSDYLTKEMIPPHTHPIDMTTEKDAGAHTHQIHVYGYNKGGGDDGRQPVNAWANDWPSGPVANWTTSDPGNHQHAIKGNTKDSTTATQKNLPAYEGFYIWRRTK